MKFDYEYRTSDNVRHSGVVSASSREEAYAQLKARGIRPGSVAPAPGFVNWLVGHARAVAVAALAALALAVALAAALSFRRAARVAARPLDDTTRRQVIGDPAVIAKGLRTGWSDVFTDEGDRFLASYAVPGAKAALRNTTEAALRRVAGRSVVAMPADGLEARQIKAMVAGLKQELGAYLADGGTIAGYARELTARQDAETAICDRVKTELDTAAKAGLSEAELEALYEKRNAELRVLGLKTIPYGE